MAAKTSPHHADFLATGGIPNLNFTKVCANSEMRSFLGP